MITKSMGDIVVLYPINTDVPSLDEDDCASVVSKKMLPSEGLHCVLRLLFQLCPSAAAEAPLQLQRACDFEDLFGSAPSLSLLRLRFRRTFFIGWQNCFLRRVCGSRQPWTQGSYPHLVSLLVIGDQVLLQN